MGGEAKRPGPWIENAAAAETPEPVQFFPDATRPAAFLPDAARNFLDDEAAVRRTARIRASARLLRTTDYRQLDDAGRAALFRSCASGITGFDVCDPHEMFNKRTASDMAGNLDLLRRFADGEWQLIEDPDMEEWRAKKAEGEEAAAKFAHEKLGGAKDAGSFWRGFANAAGATAAARGGAAWQNVQPSVERMDAEVKKLNYDNLDEKGKAEWRRERIEAYDRKMAIGSPVAAFLKMTGGLDDNAKAVVQRAWRTGELTRDDLKDYNDEQKRQILGAIDLMRGDQKTGTLLFVPGVDISESGFKADLYAFQQSILDIPGMIGSAVKDGYDYAMAARLSGAEREEAFRRLDEEAAIKAALEQPLVEPESFLGAMGRGVAENAWFLLPSMAGAKGLRMMRAAQGLEPVAKGGKVANFLSDLGVTLTPWRAGKHFKDAAKLAEEAVEGAKAARAAALSKGVKALGEAKIDPLTAQMAMRRQMAAMKVYTEELREAEALAAAARSRVPGAVAKWWGGAAVREASSAAMFASFFREYVDAADAAGVSREDSVPMGLGVGFVNGLVERIYVPGMEGNLAAHEIKYHMIDSAAQAWRKAGAKGFAEWAKKTAARFAGQTVKTAFEESGIEEPIQQMMTEFGLAVNRRQQELRKEGRGDLANALADIWEKASFEGMAEKAFKTYCEAAWESLPGSLGLGMLDLPLSSARQRASNLWHGRDEGLADAIQRGVDARLTTEKYWKDRGDENAANPHRFEEAITAARQAFRNPQTGDVVKEVADAAGVDVKTAEALTQYLQVEADMSLVSPKFSAWSSLNMSLADIDEQTIKTVLPGYVEGSFASDPENGVYSGRVKLADGTERTIAYRVGDWSQIAAEDVENQIKDGSSLGKSWDSRIAENGGVGTKWADLTPETRRAVATTRTNGLSAGRSGVFEMTDAKGEKVRVNADDVILLASGRLADIGYGAAATQGTARHETFHSLWRFARASMDDADVQQLAKTMGVDVTKEGWENELDETMATQMERYASGHYVSHAVSSRFDRMMDGWAGNIIKFFGKFGSRDEVTDPDTGKPYKLKDLYDKVLRGELGTGALGVELAKLPAQPAETPAKEGAAKSAMPVEVTDAERAAAEAEAQEEAKAEAAQEEPPAPAAPASPAPAVTTAPVPVATAKDPADASTPNQRYYKVGLPNSPVKLVGRLEVRDAETGLVTSTDADYHDRGNQNRDDRSEESRALVEKIGANPDPLQIGTVQPIASNGVVWMLPNGDVIIGNHRVNGVRLAYGKGTASELEKFVREDAAKRGIEIGADVKKPLLVFVLERIESPDGKADVHEVVRLANESQNRGFNVREQASNDAKILIDNNLLPRMEFRADGRIDETKSGEAIGKFRQETGAQGMIAEDGSLTEDGQTRIQNAALAALLGGEGTGALLQKIMANAGRLDMQNELRALMKMTPELMALAEAKPGYDLRGPLAEALQLFTEWRDKDETLRVEKGKTRHDWRETKNGQRVRGISWEQFMSQGDMFRTPSDEAKILGDLFAKAESLRSFDREDVESEAGKKRVIDLISGYLADYIANARAVNTETDDMFGGSPASRAEVMAAQRAKEAADGGVRFSVVSDPATVERLEKEIADGDYHVTYRAVERVTLPDGTEALVPPMNGYDPKTRQYIDPVHEGDWVKADIDEAGIIDDGTGDWAHYKISYRVQNQATGKWKRQDTTVAFNPYIHSSFNPFNDQFSAAYNRPNLVVVRLLVPKSAATGEKAHPRAKDAPGFTQWKAGGVAGQLKALGKPERKVLLSNYAKIDKVLSYSDVADLFDEMTDGVKEKISIPENVMPPGLKNEMERRGYRITPMTRYSIAARLDKEREELEAKGGKLLLAHHGTDSAGFTEFEKTDDMGHFFAKSRFTAGSYIRKGQRADVNKKALPGYDELLKQKEDEGWIERGYALEDADGKLTGELGGRWDRPFSDREMAEAMAIGRKVVEAVSYNDTLYRADQRIPYRDLLDDGEQRSGVYDVALRMENPYIIDCKGANWDSIIDWEGAEDIPDAVVYDKIRLEEEEGHYYLELREHGQDESQYESFATVEDAAQWAEKELGEEIARRFRDAEPEFLKDPYNGGRTQLTICDDDIGWVKPSEEDDGWYLEPKNTRDIVAEAFEDPDCDGVIFKNVVDNGGGVVDAYEDDVYVVRESKQAKLVDEMTYADDGSIIPVEERLNWSKQDIRYSVSQELIEAMEQRERRALEPRAPQGESPYFTEADGAVEMPISALRTVKDEPQRSIENARKHMEDAAAGRMPKRAPVSVADNGDGTYTVIDGNATTWAAARGGLESVRANVVGKNRGTPLANSHYLVNKDKSGCDADGKLHTHGLEGLTGEAAREKAYEQAGENTPLLKAVVDGAAKAVGCEAKSRKTLKKRQRVDEKAASYGGDYSRVVDLIDGTLILDPSQDMTTALKELRKNLPSGASIAQVKKLSSPDAGGYWDVKVSVRFKNGGIGEVILVDRNILDAKDNRGGHALYDYQRAIEEAEGTGEDAAELFFALKQIELAIYSHNTPRAAQHQATWDAAKASASASLTRFLESHWRDFISSMDMGTLKDLLEGSHLHQPASLDSYATPARSFIQNDISDSSLVSGTTRKILSNSGLTVNGENDNGGKKFSVKAPRSRLAYPSLLNTLSDEELLSAAVASRIALGKSDKVSDRSVKVSTVQKLVRRLHPDWDTTKVGVEAQRVMSGAQKFARRIREDLDRGVSESLVLEHLPDAMRSTFGAEMRQEARQGARLGAFGARANAEIGARQEKIIEDAVRVQTGLDASAIENYYGINLSETIMHLAENPLTEKPPQTAGANEDVQAAPGQDAEEAEQPAAEIDAKVKAVVKDIVSASGRQADADEQNRQNRKDAAGRDAENEKAMGGESEGEEGSVPDEESSGEGDFLAAAAAKEGLNLENPRHLARFVAELARRQYVKEHHLALNADVWRDLVAVQFLRKTAQSVYAKLCRDLTYSRSRETAMQRIAKLDAVPTVAGLLSEMEFVGALINAQRIRDTQKQMCEKLDLFLWENFGAQGRFKPDKEEGKRKVSAEAEQRARYMRHAMWLTPDAAAEEARQLQETLDALSVDFKDAGRDRDQSREFIKTIRKLNVLREFGALRYKPVGEIEAAVQWWQDFARGESDDIVREMSDRDIRTKKAAHLLAVAFADPKRKTIREGDSMSDKLNRFITGHMGFISLLQDCMRYASDADAAAVKDIIDYIAREIQKSGDRSEAEKRRHNDAFHSAVESIYGRKFDAVMKEMMAPDERFMKYMGVVGGKRVTPTKGRAMQLLVSLLQEGRKVEVEDEENPGKTKFVWEGGYHDNIVKHHREGQAAEIMRLLTPQDMNMLKWLGQWYENNRSDLSNVCHSLFGIGVYAELPNYFPVKMQLEKQGLEKGDGVGWTIFPKALTPRVRNERDFDTSANIFSMWAARMEEAAQWKHHAQLGLEMRGIFGRAELREAVRANHGASVDDLMQGFITDIMAGHGAYDRSTAGVQYFSDQIRGWTALCALGGNVGVMLKQTTSIPAFGFEIGLVNTAKYMVNAFTPDGMAAMLRIWDSEQRQTRWQVGSSEAVRNALNQNGAGILKRMFQASMITNKVGDVVPALVVGQGIYRDCLARGMSEEDAMAETWSIIERTQQSGRMENQTSIQRRNKLGRIMFQFMSTQQQYLQYETRAIRDVIARPDSVKRWGALGRAILLNHFILSSAYFWMGELYKACLGQEPPEDELKDWVITCLLGPYGSLMVAGFCCKYTLERAIKGYSWKSPSMLPMESFLKNQVNDGAKLLEAIFDSEGDTWDNMLDAAGRWMSDSNSVVRDLRKIYRYRVKGEQKK